MFVEYQFFCTPTVRDLFGLLSVQAIIIGDLHIDLYILIFAFILYYHQ